MLRDELHDFVARITAPLSASTLTFFFQHQLMELQSSHFQSNQEQRHQIKAASYVAGVQGKPVVLFVPEDQTDDTLQDICAVMVEGRFIFIPFIYLFFAYCEKRSRQKLSFSAFSRLVFQFLSFRNINSIWLRNLLKTFSRLGL